MEGNVKIRKSRHENVIIVEATGLVNMNTIIDTGMALARHEDFEKGMNQVYDISRATTDMPAPEIKQLVLEFDNYRSLFGENYRLALVVARDLDYGLGRMFQVYAGELSIETGVFRSLEEAEDWAGVSAQAGNPDS